MQRIQTLMNRLELKTVPCDRELEALRYLNEDEVAVDQIDELHYLLEKTGWQGLDEAA